ncbi:hypothetical protein SOCE26_084470 [Sorangium cellulosum]|uniref:Uncharacterized protein n=1 Tax=Sorangium cellulosum TaxID=56 RepID=A0A2L0F5Y9_SORCE|nr:hypothetical protein [Sorangium cellulosum]AUX46937.1 hypothetical protein SOCE26_084470 [Sorangium cellulosum]
MDELKPRRAVVPSAPPVPLVVVAGCPAEFVAECRDAAARLGVLVRECDLRSLRVLMATSLPYAIIVMEDLYRFDPDAFDAIVRQSPASLMRIDPGEAHDPESRRLLIDAVLESAAAEPSSGIRAFSR